MDTLIPLYAESGYKALDLNFCEMMNPYSILNTGKAWDYIEKLQEEKEKYSLSYIQSHVPYPHDYRSLSMEGKELSDNSILKAMEFSSALGIPHVVIHPIKGSVQDNINYFSSLLDRQKEPIKIAIENMETREGIWSADELIEMAKALSPMAGICLDTGHAFIAGENIPDFIRKAGKLLLGTHIADNDGKKDLHLLPGFGKIEWESVMKAFRESYEGYLNYECMFFSRNLPQSLSKDVINLSLEIGKWLLSL